MRKYERQVANGIRALNCVFGRRWLKWIDLDKLDMRKPGVDDNGCGCIGAQIAAKSQLCDRSGRYGALLKVLGRRLGMPGPVDGYSAGMDGHGRVWWVHCGNEWKRQIRELRGDE